jgi:hypothetical protein
MITYLLQVQSSALLKIMYITDCWNTMITAAILYYGMTCLLHVQCSSWSLITNIIGWWIIWLQQSIHITNRSFFTRFLWHNVTIMQLENLKHFSNLCDMAYTIVFSLKWFGINEMRPDFSCVWGYQKVTSMPHHQSCTDWLCWRHKHIAHVISPSSALAFGMKMNETHNSTSSSRMQVENQWNKITDEEILDIIRQLQRGNDYWHIPQC